jgi:hypothetical protein
VPAQLLAGGWAGVPAIGRSSTHRRHKPLLLRSAPHSATLLGRARPIRSSSGVAPSIGACLPVPHGSPCGEQTARLIAAVQTGAASRDQGPRARSSQKPGVLMPGNVGGGEQAAGHRQLRPTMRRLAAQLCLCRRAQSVVCTDVGGHSLGPASQVRRAHSQTRAGSHSHAACHSHPCAQLTGGAAAHATERMGLVADGVPA